MIGTSTIAGTLVSSYSPSARIVAAISLSTAFLAPGTSIVPCSSPTRRTMICPPGPGSVFTSRRVDRSLRSLGAGGSRPTSMLPWCWQAVTSSTVRTRPGPAAHRRAGVAGRPRGRRQPRPPRDDLVLERRAGRRLASSRPPARSSPTAAPSSRIADGGRTWRETTTYRWSLPWFAWVFALPAALGARPPRRRRPTTAHDARHRRRRGGRRPTASTRGRSASSACSPRRRCRRRSSTPCSPRPSNSPPTTSASATAASASPAAIVRAGIILVLPVAALADRIGRRRIVTAMAIAAPARHRRRGARRRRSRSSSPPRPSAARSGWRSTSSSPSWPPRRCPATAGPTRSACWRWPAGSAPAWP